MEGARRKSGRVVFSPESPFVGCLMRPFGLIYRKNGDRSVSYYQETEPSGRKRFIRNFHRKFLRPFGLFSIPIRHETESAVRAETGGRRRRDRPCSLSRQPSVRI